MMIRKTPTFLVTAVGLALVSTTSPALAAALATEVAVGGSAVAGDHPVKNVHSVVSFGGPTTDDDVWVVSCQLTMDTSVPPEKSRVRSGADVRGIARFSPKVILPSAQCVSTGGYRRVDLGTVTMTRVGGAVTTSRTDIVPVEVALRFSIPAPTADSCGFVVSGSAPGTYDEETQTLTLGRPAGSNDLLVSDVEQCANLAEGSPARIAYWTTVMSSTDGNINMRP